MTIIRGKWIQTIVVVLVYGLDCVKGRAVPVDLYTGVDL